MEYSFFAHCFHLINSYCNSRVQLSVASCKIMIVLLSNDVEIYCSLCADYMSRQASSFHSKNKNKEG